MLPVILAAVGGYLVYDSLKSKEFADGGMMAKGGELKDDRRKIVLEIADTMRSYYDFVKTKHGIYHNLSYDEFDYLQDGDFDKIKIYDKLIIENDKDYVIFKGKKYYNKDLFKQGDKYYFVYYDKTYTFKPNGDGALWGTEGKLPDIATSGLNVDLFIYMFDSKKDWDDLEYEEEDYADGGMMDDGGQVGEGFLIKDMREKLNRMFPDSFGFSVGNVSKQGNKTLNSAALIVDENDPYRGLEDKDIQSKLFFPQYKRDHNINFRVMQGGENTYFYFALESEKGDEYIGQFGFKDGGDVPSSYITRFLAFLMEQYGLPFSIKHSVMADGGIMAKGGLFGDKKQK